MATEKEIQERRTKLGLLTPKLQFGGNGGKRPTAATRRRWRDGGGWNMSMEKKADGGRSRRGRAIEEEFRDERRNGELRVFWFSAGRAGF